MSEIVSVQFLEGGKLHYYLAPGPRLRTDSLCVVETEYGPAVARVVKINPPQLDRKNLGPLRRVLRTATPRDLEQRKNNERLEREAYRFCRQKVQEKSLAMKLVDVAYTLEGRKAVFYFTSENRVDFRELVKELAQALRVKIEMRQIGVRDEARRLGGVGACGRTLCCCTFLKDFVSVSIRMAKDQNVSLNPTKVSGICGRLMCCLSYEYDPARAKRKKGEERGADGEANALPACADDCAACPNAETARPAEPGHGPQSAQTAQPGRRPGQAPPAKHGGGAGQGHRAHPGGRPGWNPQTSGHDNHQRRDRHPHRPDRRPEPPRGTRGGPEGAKPE
jgi:cell fate regulator YaaT (PSP1 superfamily)